MSSEIPTTQRAVIVQPDKTVAVQTVPVFPPVPGKVLIKVAVAAQNPSDWKSIHWGMVKPGQGVGSDFVGRVVALGDGVDDVKLGERVAGWQVPAQGDLNTSDLNTSTAYREYTTIAHAPLIRIPDNVSDEEGATLFVAAGTAAFALRNMVRFPLNAPYNRCILVWGGSSAVGFYAIQFAKLTGWKVIATASPHNHPLVTSAGADAVIDYHAPDAIAQIVAAAGHGGVDYVVDAITEDLSYHVAAQALRPDGPRAVAVMLPLQDAAALDATVEYRLVLPISMLGKEISFAGAYFPKCDEDARFGVDFCKRVEEWLRDGRVKPMPPTVMPGGLSGVQAGLEYMKAGKVSGTKLVYRIAETPA